MASKSRQYVDLRGRTFAMAGLDKEERQVLEKLEALARNGTEWSRYRNQWLGKVQELYSDRGLSRTQIMETPIYRIGQDIGSRLAIAQGRARHSDYRDELEQLVLTQFRTRREFCEASGLSEDMLSHVLARRKNLSIDTLNVALERVGYTLHIFPLSR